MSGASLEKDHFPLQGVWGLIPGHGPKIHKPLDQKTKTKTKQKQHYNKFNIYILYLYI